MARLLKNLRIDEVSAVIRGANQGAQVLICKADDAPYLFNDIMLRNATDDDEQRTNIIPDDDKVSSKLRSMVDAMIAAAPSLDRQQAAHYLLHNAHGRRLAEHLNSISKQKETIMPQVNILKCITIMDDALMAQARLSKRADETDAKSYSRLMKDDSTFLRQCAAIQDAKHTVAKGMATLQPTSVGVGSTLVADDSAEAVRLLTAAAAKNGRSFETEFADPANATLASRTYTANHRSSVSMDYLEQ
jgi:hypothetical protein